jgi:hypothetical protein
MTPEDALAFMADGGQRHYLIRDLADLVAASGDISFQDELVGLAESFGVRGDSRNAYYALSAAKRLGMERERLVEIGRYPERNSCFAAGAISVLAEEPNPDEFIQLTEGIFSPLQYECVTEAVNAYSAALELEDRAASLTDPADQLQLYMALALGSGEPRHVWGKARLRRMGHGDERTIIRMVNRFVDAITSRPPNRTFLPHDREACHEPPERLRSYLVSIVSGPRAAVPGIIATDTAIGALGSQEGARVQTAQKIERR